MVVLFLGLLTNLFGTTKSLLLVAGGFCFVLLFSSIVCIMQLLVLFSLYKLAISSLNLSISELWSQGVFCRVESFLDCLSINLCSYMKDFIAMTSMFSKVTFSSRQRLVSPAVSSLILLLEFRKQEKNATIVIMLVS